MIKSDGIFKTKHYLNKFVMNIIHITFLWNPDRIAFDWSGYIYFNMHPPFYSLSVELWIVLELQLTTHTRKKRTE